MALRITRTGEVLALLAVMFSACGPEQPREADPGPSAPVRSEPPRPVRLDPLLRQIAEPVHLATHPAFSGFHREIAQLRDTPAGTSIRCLIEARAGGRPDLSAIGAEEIHRYGDVYTAYVPVDRIGDLATMPGVARARAARKLRPLIDISVPASGAVGLNLSAPAAGRGDGALVGLVDTGVDPTHPDFITSTGQSRVVWSLNQNGGAIEDTNGHGTHCTGIMAGNGRAGSSPVRIGVAPTAAIAAVATTFVDADIVAGVKGVFDQAEQRSLPAAVNLSLGGHSGPHDGTDSFDMALDALSGPGRVIVAAAGNEGDKTIHASGTVTVATASSGSAQSIAFDNASTPVAFDLYHDSPAGLRVWIQRGNGTVVGPVDPGQTLPLSCNIGYSCYIDNAVDGTDPNNGKQLIQLVLRISGTATGWRILLSKLSASDPDANFHAWNFFGAAPFTNAGTFDGNTASTIGSPATAFQTISVGAYVTRLGGSVGAVGNLATFSSRGPTADGRTTDITAPGSAIWSSCPTSICPSGYQAMQGTSMATPHVTGLAALMLAKNPLLGPDAVRSMLANTSRVVGTVPSNDWGYGKADADPSIALAGEHLPALTSTVTGPTTVGTNTTLAARTLGFLPRSDLDPQRVRFQWQKLQDGLFQNIARAGERFLSPSSFAQGDVLRVVATPVQDNASYRYAGTIVGASVISPEITVTSDTAFRGYTPEETWSLVSVPTDGAGNAALLDSFGYAMWGWDEAAQAYAPVSEVTRGRGYFVYAQPGEGVMQSNGTPPAAGDFTTPLLTRAASGTYVGRHLIGNPFPRPIYWKNLLVSSDGATYAPVTTSGLIQHVYYGQYNNRQGQYLMNELGGLDGVIHPWEAVWVIVTSPAMIKIPQVQPIPLGLLGVHGPSYPNRLLDVPAADTEPLAYEPLASPGGGRVGKLRQRDAVANGFKIQLHAVSGELRDDFNFVGVAENADDGYDPLDVIDAGTLNSSHVVLSIDRRARESNPGLYCQDIQQPPRHGSVQWPVQVETRGVGSVTLTWSPAPSGWDVTMTDETDGRVVDMAAAASYVFAAADSAPRRLTVRAGKAQNGRRSHK
jgi:subtilisin family serine protease